MNLGGKVMKELSRSVDFTDTLRAGFALFAGKQFAELAATLDQLGANRHEYLIAGLHWGHAPLSDRTIGCLERHINLAGIGLRILTNDIVDVRGVSVGYRIASVDPFAVDEQAVLIRHKRRS